MLHHKDKTNEPEGRLADRGDVPKGNLVLQIKKGESLMIGECEVVFMDTSPYCARVVVKAPRDIIVTRPRPVKNP